jgi:hypothetical protein
MFRWQRCSLQAIQLNKAGRRTDRACPKTVLSTLLITRVRVDTRSSWPPFSAHTGPMHASLDDHLRGRTYQIVRAHLLHEQPARLRTCWRAAWTNRISLRRVAPSETHRGDERLGTEDRCRRPGADLIELITKALVPGTCRGSALRLYHGSSALAWPRTLGVIEQLRRG